ncbi:SAM-dependent methyltransferase [Roseimaritima ulvae]|uniref:Putative 23S rRNA ribose 2'-O-ribose methyltransferase n=1 Tax=Roseimaritima ulvae TaxID=980254 RepID=A0A5B9QN14_9BACT|nr:SAM-dependent methyltransferase [Roseimaritima ulvae]QEG40487.1 putative 23S rRNA ribose 2'-O-ribose methyltransferase [Roseimaritima ulvae]
MTDACFVMIGCQRGAEATLKSQLADQDWRLAFSRPGFVTFKHDGPVETLPSNPFARTVSRSVGKARAAQITDLLTALDSTIAGLQTQRDQPFDQLHVWARDRAVVGEFSFEPHATNPLAVDIADRVFAHVKPQGHVAAHAPNLTAGSGQDILDIILVDPGEWWFGWHKATSLPTRWPGAIQPIDADKPVVSRAYFKIAEALAWSGLPMRPGDRVMEIGSAPGGACQRLLELGFVVTGIDPADMHQDVMSHRNMTHIRARAEDLKRSEYRDAKWLVVDANIKPAKTLWSVEQIVGHRDTRIQGMLLTLKLGSYERAAEIPHWIDKVKRWGFEKVDVRQLATGRCEVCLAAQK